MSFRITGLSPEPFQPLFGLPEAELATRNIVRVAADGSANYPDRIEMRHARAGETLLLLNHEFQPAASPYRGRHAIYVIEGATQTYDAVDAVPEVMRPRLLSLRGFDAKGMIQDADVVEGRDIEAVIERLFADPAIAYIHVHNARRGCYSGRIDRA